MDWLDNIISLYLQISECYTSTLQYFCQKTSNNSKPAFTDEEIMTIYISGIMDGFTTIKHIHQHAVKYWHHLFPKLPSYAAFNRRINQLGSAFSALTELYQCKLSATVYAPHHFRLMDSMPIVMARQGRRFTAKVAPEIADAGGYCAAKNMHYYGVKLHILASYTKGSLPIPEYVGLTHAGMNDGKAYESIRYDDQVSQYEKFADKAYIANTDTKMYTPIKKEKGQECLEAADQLYSTAISKIRQPIESLNNWLQEKTNIQIASKVRATSGLMVHVFGRMAAAFRMLYEKFNLTD